MVDPAPQPDGDRPVSHDGELPPANSEDGGTIERLGRVFTPVMVGSMIGIVIGYAGLVLENDLLLWIGVILAIPIGVLATVAYVLILVMVPFWIVRAIRQRRVRS